MAIGLVTRVYEGHYQYCRLRFLADVWYAGTVSFSVPCRSIIYGSSKDIVMTFVCTSAST